MKRAMLPLVLAPLAGFGAGPGTAAPPCGKQIEQSYGRKADLPRGAIEAIGPGMAEKGGAYQRGDVMRKGVPLYRFVSATRSGCRISVHYEQGGFVRGWGTFSLLRVDGAWKLVGRD